MRAIPTIVVLSARHQLAERGAIISRAAFYALILFVFSRLWGAVLEDVHDLPLRMDQLIWYLAITEWIALSVPTLHIEIEDEVRRGDLVYRLARPMAYPIARLAEAFGALLVRMGLMIVPGFSVAWFLTGQLPTEPLLMLWLVPLGLGAGSLVLLMMFAIGFTSLWLHDCRPLWWIWQKCAFVLGGMLLPLSLYPVWLQEVAAWTPFAALFHGPGGIALGVDSTGALGALIRLSAWLAVAALVLTWAYRRSVRHIEIGGG